MVHPILYCRSWGAWLRLGGRSLLQLAAPSLAGNGSARLGHTGQSSGVDPSKPGWADRRRRDGLGLRPGVDDLAGQLVGRLPVRHPDLATTASEPPDEPAPRLLLTFPQSAAPWQMSRRTVV